LDLAKAFKIGKILAFRFYWGARAKRLLSALQNLVFMTTFVGDSKHHMDGPINKNQHGQE